MTCSLPICGPYRVDSDPEAPSLMLVSKGLKRRKEGQEAFNIGTREIPSLIEDENKMLAFFRSLQSRLATNLSVKRSAEPSVVTEFVITYRSWKSLDLKKKNTIRLKS